MFTTNISSEEALGYFGKKDCSQIVFGEFAEQIGLDEETALKIAAPFGGGMWAGETCGAVVGALMAIGLLYGQGDEPDPEKKNLMLEKAAEFRKKFAEKNGSCMCRDLLGYKIPEEMEKIMAENKFAAVCGSAIVDACEILADVLNSVSNA